MLLGIGFFVVGCGHVYLGLTGWIYNVVLRYRLLCFSSCLRAYSVVYRLTRYSGGD